MAVVVEPDVVVVVVEGVVVVCVLVGRLVVGVTVGSTVSPGVVLEVVPDGDGPVSPVGDPRRGAR